VDDVDDVDGADRPRERDRAVERLLRRPGQGLQVPPAGGVTDSCLDAETVAAWVDGGLAGAALEDAQVHVADCARCQTLVGTLARISPAGPARQARPWSWTASLKWLVPLTAAAAAIALWVAVPRDRFERVAGPEQLGQAQTAIIERQAAETKAPEPAQLDSRTPPPVIRSKEAIQSPTVVAGQAESELAKSDVAKDSVARNDVPSRLEAENLKEAQVPAALAAPAAASAPPVTAEKAGAMARSAARVAGAAAGAPADVARIEIVSPNPSVRWRIAGAVVERSTNGGSTWEAVPTGVAAELTAGAAPSLTVCWLVGRGGVVLRSIDGLSWSRVAFPEMTDLSAVRATDARNASVSTVDGRTFSTTDGGTTWIRSPL
jgi:hypothetical protein